MHYSRLLIPALFLALIGCQKIKKETSVTEVIEQSIPEKIANAHGYSNWSEVSKIKFTFNVDRDSTHFERTWIWKPKTNDIISISGLDTVSYNRSEMDSISYKVNGGFVNDRYWLLTPFNLMWDKSNYTFEHSSETKAPISGETLQKLTIVYGAEGGYTPGDAYDFYFGEDYLIKEWVFRKGNQFDPSMTTTFENYVDKGGIRLALDHKKEGENFNLYFSGLEIQTD